MAYQPLQMTARPPILDAMEGLGNALTQFGNQRRRDAEVADEKKRQDQQDYVAALLKATELAKAGNHEGARAIMSPYHAQLEPVAPEMPSAPTASQGAPPAPPAPGAPAFDDESGNPGGLAAQRSTPPLPSAQLTDSVSELPGAPQQAPQLSANPIMAARQKEVAMNRFRADYLKSGGKGMSPNERFRLTFMSPTGEQQVIDPQAAVERQRAAKAAQLDAAFANSDDPVIKEMYPRIRPALLASDQPVDSRLLFQDMHELARQKRAEERQAQLDANFQARLDHDSEMKSRYSTTREDKNKNAAMAAASRAQSAASVAGARQDTASARATGLAERAISDADKMVDWKGLTMMDNKARAMISDIASDNPLSHKAAQMEFGSFMRNGQVPQEGEMKMLYDHLGGTPGAWDAFWSKIQSGDIGDSQKAILRGAIEHSGEILNERKRRALQALKKRFETPTYQMVSPDINAALKARATQAGVELGPEDLLPEPESGGAVLLGSRAPKASKGHKILRNMQSTEQEKKKLMDKFRSEFVKNGGKGLSPEAHYKAVEWARANPDSEKAAEILRAHGLEK